MNKILSMVIASAFTAAAITSGNSQILAKDTECSEPKCVIHKYGIIGSLGDNCGINEIILNYLSNQKSVPSCIDIEVLEDALSKCNESGCISYLFGIDCDNSQNGQGSQKPEIDDDNEQSTPPVIQLPDFNFPTLPDFGTRPEKPEGSTPEAGLPDDGETPDAGTPESTPPSEDIPTLPSPEFPDSDTDNGTTESEHARFISEVVSLVNKERKSRGLSPLTASNSALSKAASIRASEQARSFSHTRPDGTSWTTVLSQQGVSYRSAGENVAYGQSTPSEVMNAWMNSSGHRDNILNASYTEIGVGVYYKNGTYYWSQLFIS